MQQKKEERNIKHVTMYITESEYQLIMNKAEMFDISASKFAKQAVKMYIKHLEKHLQDAESIAA
jgi:hypothetical protein